MSATAGQLPNIVSHGPQVSARRNPGAKGGVSTVEFDDLEFFDFDLHRLELRLFFLAGKLVGRYAINFFGRKWRWHLLDNASKFAGKVGQLFYRKARFDSVAHWFAFRVVGVGCKTKPDYSLVALF